MTWDRKVKFLKKSWEARKCKVHFSPMSLCFYQKCKNNGRCWVTHRSFFPREIGVNLHSFHFFREVENEKKIILPFFREVMVKSKWPKIEKEKWNLWKFLENFPETKFSLGTATWGTALWELIFSSLKISCPVLLENFLGQLWWFPFRPFLNSKDLIAMLGTNWLIHEEGVEKMTLYKSLYFFFQFQEGEFDYILPL